MQSSMFVWAYAPHRDKPRELMRARDDGEKLDRIAETMGKRKEWVRNHIQSHMESQDTRVKGRFSREEKQAVRKAICAVCDVRVASDANSIPWRQVALQPGLDGRTPRQLRHHWHKQDWNRNYRERVRNQEKRRGVMFIDQVEVNTLLERVKVNGASKVTE